MTEYKNLSIDDLFHLAGEYSNYIMEFAYSDRWKDGSSPVCIYEFYENEYQEILKDLENE